MTFDEWWTRWERSILEWSKYETASLAWEAAQEEVKGGQAKAKTLTPEQRKEIVQKAANAC